VTDEDRLLERAQTYDQSALADLYDSYAPLIYSYLYRRLQSAPLAEDLTSEVFLRLLQALRARQAWHTSLRGWLYRVAHNLAVDHQRRQTAGPAEPLDDEAFASEDNVAEAVHDRLSRHQLHAAMAKLTPEQQHVLVLRFGQQLSAQEVAALISKSVSAVEALQHRALAALRRVMRD
jgi:RNA polymerase sigma-70 factor, ECF subfamily